MLEGREAGKPESYFMAKAFGDFSFLALKKKPSRFIGRDGFRLA
jgi:hypothetical protein